MRADVSALLDADRRAVSGSLIAVDSHPPLRGWGMGLSQFETLPASARYFTALAPRALENAPRTPFEASVAAPAYSVSIVNAELERGRRRLVGGSMLGITIDEGPAGTGDRLRLSGMAGVLQDLGGGGR